MGVSALTGRLARRASLLALGALALHELRYVLAYGGGASTALAHQGHSYLGDLAPILAAFAVSLLCARLLAAGAGRLASGPAVPPGLRYQSLACAGALLAIFSAQELTEGALSAGHPGGLAAVLANGGWIVLPLALAIGAIVACLDRLLSGAERSLVAEARRRRAPRPRPAKAAVPAAPAVTSLATLTLSFGLARRPPPAFLPG